MSRYEAKNAIVDGLTTYAAKVSASDTEHLQVSTKDVHPDMVCISAIRVTIDGPGLTALIIERANIDTLIDLLQLVKKSQVSA